MKRQLCYLLSLGIFLTITFSCSNSILDEDNFPEEPIQEGEIVTFIYKGKVYKSEVEYIEDEIIYLDEESCKVMNEIEKLPDWAMLVYAENHYEYFDNLEMLKLKTKENHFESAMTRIISSHLETFTVNLYERIDKRGEMITYTIRCNQALSVSLPQVRFGSTWHTWHNVISSFELGSTYNNYDTNTTPQMWMMQHSSHQRGYATFFEGVEYNGPTISVVVGVEYPYFYASNLKKIKTGNKTWNDRIGSFRLVIGLF